MIVVQITIATLERMAVPTLEHGNDDLRERGNDKIGCINIVCSPLLQIILYSGCTNTTLSCI